jgi:hypothetical protein
MHVEFELSRATYPDQRAGFEEVLAGVGWAPVPVDEATRRAVSDWTK